MATYREKPRLYDAVQWTGDLEAVQVVFPEAEAGDDDTVRVAGPMGTYSVSMNNWIVRDGGGNLNVFPDETFNLIYEEDV